MSEESEKEKEQKRKDTRERVRLHRKRKAERGDVNTTLFTSFTEKQLLLRAAKRLKYASVTEFVMDCCKEEARKVGITLEQIAKEMATKKNDGASP